MHKPEVEENLHLVSKHFDRDGAEVNDKLVAHYMQSKGDKPNILISDSICGNHTNNIAELMSVKTLANNTILPTLYSLALLFRMGNYFIRLIWAVGAFFTDAYNPAVRCGKGCPPPASRTYTAELGDYLLRNYLVRVHGRSVHRKRRRQRKRPMQKRTNGGGDADEGGEADSASIDGVFECYDFSLSSAAFESNAARLWKAMWEAFVAVFNCLPIFSHKCANHACCSGFNPEVTRLRMKQAAKDFLFAALPTIPNAGKWTKSGPSVDYFITSCCAGPFLQEIWSLAFGKVTVTQRRCLSKDDSEQSWLEQTEWHAVGSKRIRGCRRGG